MSKRAGINKSRLSRTLRNTKFTQALKVDFKRLFLAHSRKMIRQMLREFDSHPVTTEISSGPKAGNTSNTLSGRGNLFSFIGFVGSGIFLFKYFSSSRERSYSIREPSYSIRERLYSTSTASLYSYSELIER